jgi:NAD+-dependent secondary alcohol dehydrogenase Adh1
VGVGGLGHIAVQILKAMSSARVIAVDTSEPALDLAAALGADHIVKSDENVVEAVRELCEGQGAQAVLDFVGEHDTPQQVPAMLAQGGTYYIVGYGGELALPLADIILREINVVGNLVGSYTELSELMALAADGKVTLHTRSYPLEEINAAIDDFSGGRIQGRGVIVPAGA